MMRLCGGKPKRDFNRYVPLTWPFGQLTPSINRYTPFAMFFMGKPVVTDDWAEDIPVLDAEIQLLQVHITELLPESTEGSS